VIVTDPKTIANAAAKWPDLRFADTVEKVVAELVVLLTEWREYVALDPTEFAAACAGASHAGRSQRLGCGALAGRGVDLPRPRAPMKRNLTEDERGEKELGGWLNAP
jgi:nucleoid-associated protein YgaU